MHRSKRHTLQIRRGAVRLWFAQCRKAAARLPPRPQGTLSVRLAASGSQLPRPLGTGDGNCILKMTHMKSSRKGQLGWEHRQKGVEVLETASHLELAATCCLRGKPHTCGAGHPVLSGPEASASRRPFLGVSQDRYPPPVQDGELLPPSARSSLQPPARTRCGRAGSRWDLLPPRHLGNYLPVVRMLFSLSLFEAKKQKPKKHSCSI